MLRVEVADVSQDHAVLTVLGPGAGDIAAGLDGVRASVKRGPFGTIDLIVARDRLPGAAGDLVRRGAVAAGMWAFEALRIAAHVPRLGLDTDHRTIPHEVGWIGSAVHLDKGDALLFVDGLMHGGSSRTNDGERRIVIYRYGPSWARTRFGYEYSGELLDRLPPERRRILEPVPPARPPASDRP